MIRMAPDIEYLDSRKVRLPAPGSDVLIELTADAEVDIAVVTDSQLKEFEERDDVEDLDIDWFERVRNHDYVHTVPPGGRSYLLIWNANEERPATVAYKFTTVG